MATTYVSERTPALRLQAAIWFAVAIAGVGAVMMTLTSSPSAKGASFLWLPAALQLMAGVWLGPWYGLLAGGVGAYAAGILAYGGWGLVDIIQNPIAGGVANALLPWLLFSALGINPTLGAKPGDVLKAVLRTGALLVVVLVLAFITKALGLGLWGHVVILGLTLVVATIWLSDLEIQIRHFLPAFVVVVVICAVSAFIGMAGWVVGGKTWQQALVDLGIGWFLGDTVSALLGLYMLAMFTDRAREAGIAE